MSNFVPQVLFTFEGFFCVHALVPAAESMSFIGHLRENEGGFRFWTVWLCFRCNH